MNITRPLAAIALAASTVAPAWAANDGVACSIADVTPSAQACEGFFTGNVISGNADDLLIAGTALQALGLAGADGTWLEKVDTAPGISGSTITFTTLMSGITYVGMHFGKAAGANPPGVDLRGGGTGFYRFDAGPGTYSYTVNVGGLSNAALYSTTPVPEPETYALLLGGLGMVGFMARRRKSA